MGILADPDENPDSLYEDESDSLRPPQVSHNNTTHRQPIFRLPRANIAFGNDSKQHIQTKNVHSVMADDLRKKKKYMLLGYIGFLAHHQMLPWQANYTGPIIEPRLGQMNGSDFRTNSNTGPIIEPRLGQMNGSDFRTNSNTHSSTKESTRNPSIDVKNSLSGIGNDNKRESNPGILNGNSPNESEQPPKKFECFRPWKTEPSNRPKVQKLIIQPMPRAKDNTCNFPHLKSKCFPQTKPIFLKNYFLKNSQRPNPLNPPFPAMPTNNRPKITEQKANKAKNENFEQSKVDAANYVNGLKNSDSKAFYELAVKALGMKVICLKKIILAHGIDLEAELKKEEYKSIFSSQPNHFNIKSNIPTAKNGKLIPMAEKLTQKVDPKYLPKLSKVSNTRSDRLNNLQTPRTHQNEKSKTQYPKAAVYGRDVNQKRTHQNKGSGLLSNLKNKTNQSKSQGNPFNKSAKLVSLDDFFKHAQNVFKLGKLDTKLKNKKYKTKRCSEKSQKPKPLKSGINLKQPIKLKLSSKVPTKELNYSGNDAAFDSFIDFVKFVTSRSKDETMIKISSSSDVILNDNRQIPATFLERTSSTKEQDEKMLKTKSSSEVIQKEFKLIPGTLLKKTEELNNSNERALEAREINKPTMMDVDLDISMMNRDDNNCDSNLDYLYDSDVEDFDFGSDESD